MTIAKSKTLAITIAIFLTFSMTASLMLIPSANAHSPAWDIPTYAFCNVAPNPAGVGQTVNIGMWLDIPPPTASGAQGDRWQNFKVTVTLPDGTTTTLGPFVSDDTGGTHADYTPTELGNYTFFFSFPGQVLKGINADFLGLAYIGDYFEPSNATTMLTVQSTAVPAVPQTALPTNYWSRPIESVNDLWYTISGNWLGFGAMPFANTGEYNITGSYNPYSSAPTTAHIIWTKPLAFGGLVGGEFGGTDTSNFYSTSQYEPKFAPIIMNGILYYTLYPTTCTAPEGWVAVNLQTGQTLWTKNTTDVLRCGQILDYVSPNQYGSIAYLWSNPSVAGVAATTGPNINGGTWNMWDAMTGNFILSVVGNPAGTVTAGGSAMTTTEDANGDLIGYYTNVTYAVPGNPYTPVVAESLNMWNSTQAILYPTGFVPGVTVANWMWRPVVGSSINFNAGIVWSKPLPLMLSGVPLPASFSITTVNSGVILLTAEATEDLAGFFNTGFAIQAGYNANTGAQLWITNRTLDAFARDQYTAASNGLFFYINADTGTLTAYSMTKGSLAWGPVALTGTNGIFPVPDPYNSIGGYISVPANGALYVFGFGGDIWSINMTTGTILWYTNTNTLSGLAGSDTPYGVWPLWIFSSESIAGGVLFVNEGHEYSPPLFRGASQLALNITNGKPVWSIMSFDVTNPVAISDGIGVVLNAYDNQIYAYGMGPSKTTVNAPDVGVTTATPITITGTVTDISAGSQQQAVAANFPNGLPCVSDASMTQWMEYAYMQQPLPTNATGVPVTIAVTDKNGNCYNIGTTTTNPTTGFFSLNWTPIIPGNYTVTATFAGTKSYYGSYANAAFYASSPAATAAPTASPVTGLASTATVELGIAIVVIVIIICVAVLAVLMLRKRP
jgi:hypothetical protein